jgi:sporulation protein YlmC with PRC-barrel domain
MAGARFESGQVSRILQQIYEGMPVYDQRGDKIGTVEYVYLGELTEVDEKFGPGEFTSSIVDGSEGSLIEEFARAIVLTEQVPDIWRERLLSHGFIRISKTGLFTADRYAMPAQIASVTDDRVTLCVSRDRLIKA